MKQVLENLKKEIQHKGLGKIRDYFDFDIKSLTKLDPEVLKHLHNMARLGMQFEREINISKRATEMNFVRIGKLVSDSKSEIKAYIKRTMPEYVK